MTFRFAPMSRRPMFLLAAEKKTRHPRHMARFDEQRGQNLRVDLVEAKKDGD